MQVHGLWDQSVRFFEGACGGGSLLTVPFSHKHLFLVSNFDLPARRLTNNSGQLREAVKVSKSSCSLVEK